MGTSLRPEPARLPWGIPAAVAVAVGGLLIFRAVTGRDEPAPSSTAPGEPASALPPASADFPVKVVVPPRCAELGAEPYVIGEPAARKPAPRPSAAPAASIDDGGLPVLPRANPLDEVLDELSQHASQCAEESWKKHKAPMAAYHLGVAAHARRLCIDLKSSGKGDRP